MPGKLTTESFIEKAKNVHGNRYDYSKVNYDGTLKKVCIICHEHGDFWQTPHNHISRKQGCPKCGGGSLKENQGFIDDAIKIHGNKYLYDKIKYIGNKNKVCITCPKHGDFWQTPNSHLTGHGCPLCKAEETKKRLTVDFKAFKERAKNVHGDKYTYHEDDFINLKTKTKITCPIHGDFWQRGEDHIGGHGCQKCNPNYRSTSDFIKLATKKHNGFYKYDKVNYINKLTKVTITCPIHGDFEQIPANHLNGCKCPKCNFSKLEKKVENILEEKHIVYDYQHSFDWLGKQTLDFYLPEYNTGIECQGIQHFMAKDFMGGENGYNDTIKRDKRKYELCASNGVKLLYFTDLKEYEEFMGQKLIKSENELIDKIIITEKEK